MTGFEFMAIRIEGVKVPPPEGLDRATRWLRWLDRSLRSIGGIALRPAATILLRGVSLLLTLVAWSDYPNPKHNGRRSSMRLPIVFFMANDCLI